VTYAVKDNGIGIAPAHQQKAFEIFHRLNPPTAPARALASPLPSAFWSDWTGRYGSNPSTDQGSTFFVSLPAIPNQTNDEQ